MSRVEKAPLVGVTMGSESDLPTMQPASEILEQFDVEHEVRIVSAHRTPERMAQYGRLAVRRGLQVIIAGAGGSAHLPGMIASETRLPVLGVAVENTPDPLNSALGSMVRMPNGTPLATMGKGKAAAANAGLESVRILALQNEELGEAYDEYVENLAAEIEAKDRALDELGPNEYLNQHSK